MNGRWSGALLLVAARFPGASSETSSGAGAGTTSPDADTSSLLVDRIEPVCSERPLQCSPPPSTATARLGSNDTLDPEFESGGTVCTIGLSPSDGEGDCDEVADPLGE